MVRAVPMQAARNGRARSSPLGRDASRVRQSTQHAYVGLVLCAMAWAPDRQRESVPPIQRIHCFHQRARKLRLDRSSMVSPTSSRSGRDDPDRRLPWPRLGAAAAQYRLVRTASCPPRATGSMQNVRHGTPPAGLGLPQLRQSHVSRLGRQARAAVADDDAGGQRPANDGSKRKCRQPSLGQNMVGRPLGHRRAHRPSHHVDHTMNRIIRCPKP